MPHPAYSYLSPSVLAMALDFARELRQAETDISNLAFGSMAAYSYAMGGRAADKQVAVKDWVGPHHETFELLFENEQESTRDTLTGLGNEADAWAQFWATATNARNDRLHDEAMDRHSASMQAYRSQIDAYNQQVADNPDDPPPPYYFGSPPMAPSRPPFVTTPTAATDYAPTG